LKTKGKPKLVRDKIPEIIFKNNGKFSFHLADEKEFERRLKDKLKEEICEFNKFFDEEELADIFEVLDAILKLKKYDRQNILKIKAKKRKERGGFENRVILDSHQQVFGVQFSCIN
jgi:predicted house-cleaning noncanonical NTP pyrophosphatase (MazG superfamily)